MINNRVLLIRPSTVMKGAAFIATQFPMNLASIAASLSIGGYKVEMLDFDVEDVDERKMENKLKNFSPLIVGISCYTPTVINGHRIASLVKKITPSVVIVVGGPHISALPARTLDEFGSFDIGVIGEGEETIVELADAISRGDDIKAIKGIVFRIGQTVHMSDKRPPIRDLDRLPFPDRSLINIPLYKGQSHRGFSREFLKITEIMTSRGCPNRCIFCASEVVAGPGVRFRSAGVVKAEIGECVEKYGFNHFTISDDTFTLKEDRLNEICDEFARRGVSWNCNARVWPISKKILSVMSRSGCRGITFGVESGSPRILKLIKKNITIEQVVDAFRWSKEAGIKLVEADVIIGSHPSETREEILMTKKLISRISPDIVMFSVIVPYPGTEVYEMMKEKNLIFKDGKWDDFVLFGKEPSWRTDNFAPADLIKMQKQLLLSFYFNPVRIFKTIAKIRSLKELSYWIKGGLGFLSGCFKGKNFTNNDKKIAGSVII